LRDVARPPDEIGVRATRSVINRRFDHVVRSKTESDTGVVLVTGGGFDLKETLVDPAGTTTLARGRGQIGFDEKLKLLHCRELFRSK